MPSPPRTRLCLCNCSHPWLDQSLHCGSDDMRNLVIGSIVLVSSTAFADEAPQLTTTAARPTFALMDADGASNSVDFELGATTIKEIHLWSQRLRAQAVGASGFGGYGTVQGFLATREGVDSDYGFAGMELGGLYHASLGASADASVRLGVTLPTADENLVPLIGLYMQRPSDIVLGAPEGAWMRAGGSLGVHQSYLFARLDVGFDQRISGDGDKSDDQLLHLNAGVGVGTQLWTAAAELQVVNEPQHDDSSAETVGFTAQYHAGSISPYLGFSLSLDSPAEIDTAYTFALGARFTL